MNKHTLLALLLIACAGFTAAAQGPATNIEITKIRTQPVPLQTGEYADVWVKVRNTGSIRADNVTVRFLETFPFAADPDEQTRWKLGTLIPGETYHLHLQVRVDENAVQGTNDLRFRYRVDGGTALTADVPLEVRTDDAALVIEQIAMPDRMAPGTAHFVNLTLRNLADSYLKNIDVSLGLADVPLATADTTRQRVQKLAPGATTTVSFRLASDIRTENGLYKVPITLAYEDEAGTSFSVEQETGVLIGGRPRLEVGINENQLQTAGSTGTVTLRLINRGDGRASYVKMRVHGTESTEIISPDTVYLGNMDPDDYQTADFKVHVAGDAERLRLPVTLTYKDADGETTTQNVTITSELYSQEQLASFRSSSGGSGLLIAGIVVLLLVGGYLYRRRRH